MAYRDENDGLRTRVEDLEGELADAKATISELRGETSAATAPGDTRSALLGTTARIVRERELPHEVDEEGFEAIASLLRARLQVQATQVGRTLTVPRVFSLTSKNGKTTVRLDGDFRAQAVPVVAAPLMAGFLGGVFSSAVLMDLATHGSPLTMLHLFWIVPSLAVGAGALTRRAMRRRVEKLCRNSDGVFEAVLALVAEHAVRTPTIEARVEASEEVSAETPAPARARA